MTKTAVFPGSFDPFTIGHEDVVIRSLPLFDKIIIAFGFNSSKSGFFDLEKRMNWVRQLFAEEPRIIIDSYQGLTIDFCKLVNANFILRGLRTAADFEYERAIGQINKTMQPEVETFFLLTSPQYTAVSSSIVREIFRYGGDVSKFIPANMSLE